METTILQVDQVINKIGPFSIDLILSRDRAGNSSLMTSILQKRETICKCFWDFIVKETGLAKQTFF